MRYECLVSLRDDYYNAAEGRHKLAFFWKKVARSAG